MLNAIGHVGRNVEYLTNRIDGPRSPPNVG